MAGVVVPRDASSIVRKSTNVSTTGVLPTVERQRSHGPTRSVGPSSKQRVTRLHFQSVTAPGSGDPVAVPSGTWAMSVVVHGNWDDILVGYTGAAVPDFSAWVAHRPSGSLEEACGALSPVPVSSGTVTPVVATDGSGEDDVTVIVRFDPCEDS